MALTGDDVQAIKDIVRVAVDDTIVERRLATRDDIGHLPTKEEFFGKMDEVMGELKTIREEVAAVSHRLEDHEVRIEKIETHLGLQSD